MSDEKVIFRKGSDVLPLNQIPSSISISGLDTTRTRSVEENSKFICCGQRYTPPFPHSLISYFLYLNFSLK